MPNELKHAHGRGPSNAFGYRSNRGALTLEDLTESVGLDRRVTGFAVIRKAQKWIHAG
jgi:hypothetical protein